MAIQPTPSGSSSRLDRLSQRTPVETNRTPGPAGSPDTDPSDRIEISSAAQELSGTLAAEEVPAGTMAPERFREVLDRLGSGYYERPEVRDAVVRRIAPEF